MQLGPRTEDFGVPEDLSWLGSAHGTTEGEPITLDHVTCLAKWPDGFVPSGVALARVTASDLYGPFDAAAADGREVLAEGRNYHLLTSKRFSDTTQDVAAAGYWHGQVKVGNLPAAHGVTAPFQAAMRHIHYVD